MKSPSGANSKPKIFIIGASGHAKVIIDIVERTGAYEIAGVIDKARSVGEDVAGYPVLGNDSVLPALMAEKDVVHAVIAIGDNPLRASIAGAIKSACPHLEFPTLIHPGATIGKGVRIGQGTVVMAGAVANSYCDIGAFCIINTCAILDHDGVMEEFSSLAPGASVGGNCKIGPLAAVGIGVAMKQGTHVGARSVVGAGAAVVRDLPEDIVAYGVPARVMCTLARDGSI